MPDTYLYCEDHGHIWLDSYKGSRQCECCARHWIDGEDEPA